VRRRVLVSVLRGTLAEQFLGKTIAQANAVEHLSIEGTPALIISGPPHLMMVFRSNGAIDQTYTRLAGTTLLWQRGPLLVRVEGSLSRARLVAIARSLAVG
jgi:hypothetical protein